MASRPPPRFVVRRHDDASHRRRWLWLGVAWLGSLLVVGLVVAALSRQANAPAAIDNRQQRALLGQIDDLKQQFANLQRAAQVNEVATRSLRGTLAQREEELNGLRGDQVARLDWPALGDAAQKDGLPFRFTYFQQLHGTIVLPADFRPTRLRISIQPASGEPVNRAVAWGAALSGNITNAEGDRDAQP
jgi:hypothetical protein